MTVIKDCRHLHFCGGCSSPQTAYASSLKAKEQLLKTLFSPLCSESLICPVIPCDPILRGRNKMEFSFFQSRDHQKSLGFISSTKPKQGVPITECLLIHENTMDILQLTRLWWDKYPNLQAYFPPKNRGSLCNLTVRFGYPKKEIMVILTTSGASGYSVNSEIVHDWKQMLLNSSLDITSIFWEEKHAIKGSPTRYLSTLIHGRPYIQQTLTLPSNKDCATFNIYPKSFFQPQNFQAARIIDITRELINPQGSEQVLDLYCGVGTIGIMLSSYVKKVIGVEIVPEAIKSAKENIQINHKEDCMEVFLEDVKTFCQRMNAEIAPDIIIIDPPRCGIQNKVLKYILRIGAPRLIYISCNPKTQLEESSCLVKAGYRIKKMQPIDQFPHSPHLENILLLEK
ncbi:23S rRNA (uracil(1939)-C(5))-methyltransferase RlmD [Chlamydia sp. 17-3921]|uniref:23S rRNA (uracil(1939)-C(5))-methyltransferase RlmD n=1 Tax=Chlamydia sp. 17-3921 TaxID=2675798 RepID=UPI001919EBA1|nr:23S rRNA (uracil(1939)-C(5))-methyltransferase RlmD [Chlamydia sp. 17-3921]